MRSVLSLLLALLRMLLTAVKGALGPPTCAACDARVRPRVVFCLDCAATIAPPPEPQEVVDGAAPRAHDILAFGAFGGALAIALRRLKYQDRPDLGAPLGHLARRTARLAGLTADLVVPVPLHPRRLVERGYNQAWEIARPCAKALGVRGDASLVRRVIDTAPQSKLDLDARRQNVGRAFLVARPVRGLHVAVVDDVMTTGATLDALARTLKAAGARRVTNLVALRTPKN